MSNESSRVSHARPRPHRAAIAALYAGAMLMLVPYVGSLADAPIMTAWGHKLVFVYGAVLALGGVGWLVHPPASRRRPEAGGGDVS